MFLSSGFSVCSWPYRFGPYYTEPVIAGLDPKTFKPFICSLDLIGCPMVTDDFVVSGTCAEQMYGMCESLWEPNMVSWWCGVGLGSEGPSPPWPSGENVFTWQVMGRMVQVGKQATAAEPETLSAGALV